MRLSEVTWTDVRDAAPDLAVLPVGSTEQHGPHAPLGTDAITAEAVAAAGVESHDGDALLAPTIPVGIAEEHRAFAGTLWVSPGAFRAYVRETVASLAGHAVEGVVVVNGHGGNAAALREICARLTRDGVTRAVPFTWFEAVDPAVAMGHAGPIETALVRHVRPDLIREDRLDAAAAGGSDRWGEWVSGTNLSYDADEFTENGVVGDPREGSADLGEDLLAEAAAALAELLDAVAGR